MSLISRQAVVSSNIHTLGYHPEHQVVEVEFSGGRIYHYLGVTSADWEARVEAESLGKWVARYLKQHHEAVPGPYDPCGDEHTWPAEIESGAWCEVCGLAYEDWSDAS